MIPSHVLVSAIGRTTHRIEDLIVFPLPARWLDLPEETQAGLSWWHLVDVLYGRRIDGDMQPISPLKDVDIQFLHDAEEARMFIPRTHAPCQQLTHAINGLDNGDILWVACQFAYDGPVSD